ncbi:MAG TPA: isopentenyl-diphosphate Delta-isomerase [Chitinophagaceae bacterium]|jgi:isopentenyl-diphosphate delta-isomerase|nr:isopentenyl-diphosphate Delta-isomerase [Chitinophagaceae bacterium]HMU58484.1 isopentenyl-diphosphate Delta-isomerase [Chitinophagaceae bacterium]
MDVTKVILVDEEDNASGECEKLKAHTDGLLHRAFSVFIFNSKGEMLLQQRAMDKYHSGGLWTNACCSHPSPGEDTHAAALRRLQEEMGFTTSIEKIFDFVYKADFENGLTEYEFDHVFVGYYDGEISFNSEEVMDFRYMDMNSVRNWLASDPEQFTAWFRIAFDKIADWKANTV